MVIKVFKVLACGLLTLRSDPLEMPIKAEILAEFVVFIEVETCPHQTRVVLFFVSPTWPRNGGKAAELGHNLV